MRVKMLLCLVCWAMCAGAQELRLAFRYDPDHILFYWGRMEDQAHFAMAELQQRDVTRTLTEYGAGGYLLPLSGARLGTLEAHGEPLRDLPALGKTVTVLLGGDVKVQATAEQYVEQYGIENPVVRVGILARVVASDKARFAQAAAAAFLVTDKVDYELPATTDEAACARCQQKVLNRIAGVGQLLWEQGDAGWSVTLYRQTAGGWRRTKVSYDYRD